MKKYFLLLLLIAGVSGGLSAQLQIERQVIASAGGNGDTGSLTLSATVGELATATLATNDRQLTQGFQQSNLIVSGLIELGAGISVDLYPNPSRDFTQLEIEGDDDIPLTVELLDLAGRTLRSVPLPHNDGIRQHRFDLQPFPGGTYFARIRSTNGGVLSTLKLIHL